MSKLIMKSTEVFEINDLMYFDGSTGGDHVLMNSAPDHAGGDVLFEFNFWFDPDYTPTNNSTYLFYMSNSSENPLVIIINNNWVPKTMVIGTGSQQKYYETDDPISFVKNAVNMKINLSSEIIGDVYANDVLLTPALSGSGLSRTEADLTIGCSNNTGGNFNFFNGYIWDVKFYNSSVLSHHWKGYPLGNTNGAWEDQSASIDGTVYGDPSTGDLSFFSEIITRKLKLDPSTNSKFRIG